MTNSSDENWDGYDDDVPPFADPNIRIDYEAALGRLILAHNEVDYRLAKALERVVLRFAADRSFIQYARGSFDTRLRNLELFQKATPTAGAVRIDVAELRALNTIRNRVAHGHFDQNPFDGSFTLLGDGKGSSEKPSRIDTDKLNEATAALRSIASMLYAYEMFGDFPVQHRLPDGATPV